MKKSRFLPLFLLGFFVVSLTSFSPSKDALFSAKERKILFSKNRMSKKEAYAACERVIAREASLGNWRVLGHMAKVCVNEGIPYSKLMHIAKESNCMPLQMAIVASEKMIALSKKMGIKRADCLQLALFIEAELKTEMAQFGPYRSVNRTGLSNTIVFDPHTQNIFIHLKNHGTPLAKGYKRSQTQSILYDSQRPQLVARLEADASLDDEIAVMQALHGAEGICDVISVIQHEKEHKTYTQLISRLYPYGTLLEFIQNKKNKLSLNQRMQLALDLAKGLEAMHAKGFVHRNLGASSYLVGKTKRQDARGKRYCVAIADFSKTCAADNACARSAQVNAFYRPPEGISFETLKASDCFASDIYALGTVFHYILTSKPAPWVDFAILKDTKSAKEVLCESYKERITKYRKNRFRALIMKNWDRNNPPISESFERLILKM